MRTTDLTPTPEAYADMLLMIIFTGSTLEDRDWARQVLIKGYCVGVRCERNHT